MKHKNMSGNKAASLANKSSSLKINAAKAGMPCAGNDVHPAQCKAQLEFDHISSGREYIEPWVTKETLRQHYKMGIRTINYAMTLGLPSHRLGRNVRFKMSEVQAWLEKNGYRRFASEGRKAAIATALLKRQQFQIVLAGDVQVTKIEPVKLKGKADGTAP
jgi:hypothetical protein